MTNLTNQNATDGILIKHIDFLGVSVLSSNLETAK